MSDSACDAFCVSFNWDPFNQPWGNRPKRVTFSETYEKRTPCYKAYNSKRSIHPDKIRVLGHWTQSNTNSCSDANHEPEEGGDERSQTRRESVSWETIPSCRRSTDVFGACVKASSRPVTMIKASEKATNIYAGA